MYRSALEAIEANGGRYRGVRGKAPTLRPGELTRSGVTHGAAAPPCRPPCKYLGEYLRTVKVSCRKEERAVPQHECRHPERTSKPGKRSGHLIPPTAMLGACVGLDGTQSQPCDLCRLWAAP